MLQIGFLLGRPPGPASVLPEVVRRLRELGADIDVRVIAKDREIPHELFRRDVVVLRGLGLEELKAARALEKAGVRCCNSVGASALARDKLAAVQALAGAGLPVPRSAGADGWDEVRRIASGRAVVVKPVAGSRGQDVLIASGDQLGPGPPFPGPYLVQECIDGDGLDRKLYVVGSRVGGVLRKWPPVTLEDRRGTAFAPGSELRDVAVAVGSALALEVYGVDIIIDHRGPSVVDVNAFPGFKGVGDAARWIAQHLHAAASSWEAIRCVS